MIAAFRGARVVPTAPAMPRILVAEDDPEMMAVVTEFLVHDGFEVERIADGGRLVVELVQGHRMLIDAVVSDLRMPVCSGLEVLETLRRTRWTVPFVLMTGFADDDTRAQAARLGAILLEKPFPMQELRVALNSLGLRAPDHA